MAKIPRKDKNKNKKDKNKKKKSTSPTKAEKKASKKQEKKTKLIGALTMHRICKHCSSWNFPGITPGKRLHNGIKCTKCGYAEGKSAAIITEGKMRLILAANIASNRK